MINMTDHDYYSQACQVSLTWIVIPRSRQTARGIIFRLLFFNDLNSTHPQLPHLPQYPHDPEDLRYSPHLVLVLVAAPFPPQRAPRVEQLEAERGEVGEYAEEVDDVHAALDEPDLVRGGNEPDDVLEGEPAHEHGLGYLEEVLLLWKIVGRDVSAELMMLFIGAIQFKSFTQLVIPTVLCAEL